MMHARAGHRRCLSAACLSAPRLSAASRSAPRLLVASLLAVSLLLAACGDGASDAGPAGGVTTAGDTEDGGTGAPEAGDGDSDMAGRDDRDAEASATGAGGGGTYVIALSSDPGMLNPAITTAGPVHQAAHLLYDGLVDLTDDGELVPHLAASWDIEEDGALYRFHLRDGVVWHDGAPFTAEDVRFSFESALLELHGRTRASVGTALDRIEVIDELTIELHFTAPYGPLLQQLDVGEAPIIPAHIYAGTDLAENPANQAPIGTGPFRFVSWEPDVQIVLERNPDYHVADRPRLDEVVLRIIPDATNQVLALETGEVDHVWRVPGPELDTVRRNPDLTTIATARGAGGSNCPMTWVFNLDDPTVADRALRQALALAVDREAFVDTVLFGAGRASAAPLHSAIDWAQGDARFPDADPAAAAAALDALGWVGDGDGRRLTLEIAHFPQFGPYSELLRAQLLEVGVELAIRPLDQPVFVEAVFTDRDFQTALISYCQGPDPEIGARRMIDSAQIGPVPFSNAAGFADDRVDALLAAAVREVDPEMRGARYAELQAILVEELPYLMLVEPDGVIAHTAACQDVRASNHVVLDTTCER